MVTLPPSVDEEEVKIVAYESLIVLPLIIISDSVFLGFVDPRGFFPILGFSTLISCVSVFLHVLSLVFLYVHIYLYIFNPIYIHESTGYGQLRS